MQLLEKINFNENDTLYVLGDIIDRGDYSLECLKFVYSMPNIKCLLGNHEIMMLDYFDIYPSHCSLHIPNANVDVWLSQGGDKTLSQINQAKKQSDSKEEWYKILDWVKSLPTYAEVAINGTDYLLSHAGFDVSKSLSMQWLSDLTWSRDEFYKNPGFDGKCCVFGHTPTSLLHEHNIKDNSFWHDPKYEDKIGIDCGCVFGGLLGALCLDTEDEIYVAALSGWERLKYAWKTASISEKLLTAAAIGGVIVGGILLSKNEFE